MGLSPAYLEIAKGICITGVIIGHSLAGVVNNMGTIERLVFGFMGKAMAPGVFCLIYLFGYSQGLKRKRVTIKSNLQRIADMLLPYFFWAILSMCIYSISESRFLYPYTGQELFGKRITPVSFLLSLVTFTASWQYYFLVILLVFQAITIKLKRMQPENFDRNLKLVFWVHTTLFLFITGLFWFGSPSKIPLSLIGGFIYPNPILWFFPFFWGYIRSAKKQEIFPSFGRKGLFFYALFLILAGVEAFLHVQKWNTFFVNDQFTVITFFLSIFTLSCLGIVSNSMEKRYLSLKQSSSHRFSKSIYSFFMLFGRNTFLLFLIHQPFQWFLLVAFEKMINYQFSYPMEFFIMAVFGILFCWVITKFGPKLPKPIRRFVVGF